MKKRQLIIVLLCLFVHTVPRAIAEQGGLKSTDTETPGTKAIQAALPKPLAQLDGLEWLGCK